MIKRSSGSSSLSLPTECVHVWHLKLGEHYCALDLEACLSPQELERANRFRFERDRKRFMECRSALRHLLGRYLGIAPQDVRIFCGSKGKPEVAGEQNPSDLQFNLSHSVDRALFGFVIGRRVGVDIEQMKENVEGGAIAKRYFSAREQKELSALSVPLQAQGFFACWTRKEAYIKAVGEGLSIPLQSFSVSANPAPAAPLQFRPEDNQRNEEQWYLTDIDVPGDFRAALAIAGCQLPVHLFQI